MRLLPLLAATPLCTSFAPRSPPMARTASMTSSPAKQSHTLHAVQTNESLERAGRAVGTAFCALALSFTAITTPSMPPFFDATLSSVHSASAKTIPTATPEDAEALRALERETRRIEREAKADLKKARIEKSKEAFFEYDAKMAQQAEARLEANEKAAELEFENDKEELETLSLMELKAERIKALATTKEEKAAEQEEIKALLAREKAIERKERRALKAEKVFLAEEAQEKRILAQKLAAEQKEEQEFARVEKEYESVAELAKEDEAKLQMAKDLSKKQ